METSTSRTQKEVAEEIIKAYCSRYEIQVEELIHKNSVSRHIQRKVRGVKLDEMRKAMGYYLYIHSRLTMEQISKLLGWRDHSGVVRCIKVAHIQIASGDVVFKSYYDVLISVVNHWYMDNVKSKELEIK